MGAEFRLTWKLALFAAKGLTSQYKGDFTDALRILCFLLCCPRDYALRAQWTDVVCVGLASLGKPHQDTRVTHVLPCWDPLPVLDIAMGSAGLPKGSCLDFRELQFWGVRS